MSVMLTIFALIISFGLTTYVVKKLAPINEKSAKTDWLKALIFFGVMLLGMLAREVYNALVNGKPFNWTSFVIAALVSPLVFGAVWGNLGGPEITVASIILSFQNGFFWNSIFEGISGASGNA